MTHNNWSGIRTKTAVLLPFEAKQKGNDRGVNPDGVVHYIGRVRTTKQVMGELNKPQTIEDYERAIKDMTNASKESDKRLIPLRRVVRQSRCRDY